MPNTANAQFTIMDYTDGISLITGIGTNLPLTQQYDDANNELSPSWADTSLQLTPSAIKAGTATNLFTGGNVTNISWQRRYAGENNWTTLTNISPETWNTTTGILTVSQDRLISGHEQMEYKITGNYLDPILQLTFPLEMAITLSRVKNGTSYVLARIQSPSGAQFIDNTPATLLLVPELIRGARTDRSNDTYVWEKSTNGVNWSVITSTPNMYVIDSGSVVPADKGKLTLYPDGVTGGFSLFRVKITEGDSSADDYGVEYTSDSIAIHDYTDPLYATIESTAGNFFKNGIGSTYLICRVYQNTNVGQGEVDPTGTEFTYTWTKTDKNGNVDSTFVASTHWATPPAYPSISNTRGKCILVQDTDVDVKGNFFCSVSET